MNLLNRVLERVDHFQRHRPWLAFPVAVVKKFGDDRASRLAALIAYYGFFSLFPLLLILVTALGFVLSGNEELRREVVDSVLTQFPEVGGRIGDSLGSLQGSGLGLAAGVAGLLWAGIGVMAALQDAMNTVWDVPIKRQPNFWEKRLRALAMMVLFGVGFLVSSFLTSVGRFEGLTGLGPGGIAMSFAFNFVFFLSAFKVLTDRDVGWRAFLPGAAVGALGWLMLQWLGGLFVDHAVDGASRTYGFFAIVIGLLSWMYLLAQWVVFAAEVNAVRHNHLWPRTFFGDTLRERDREVLVRYAKVEERRPEQVVDVRFHGDEADAADEAEADAAVPGPPPPAPPSR